MQGDSQPTYSDPALQPWGPSLHFCLNESQMRQPVRAAIPRIARELRRAQPTRVVIVGHSDYEGSCRYNDALGMSRVQTRCVAHCRKWTASKSDRYCEPGRATAARFRMSSAAHDLNRRVEILVEGVSRISELDRGPVAARTALPAGETTAVSNRATTAAIC